MKKLLCLSVLFISAIFVSSVTAQELDEFVYLPIIIKAPQPPTCNLYEPNDTPGQANWIQNGETQTHCIVPKTDVDWVKFSVGAESEVIIEAAGGDLELRLYDSNLNEIGLALGLSGDSARIDYECGIWGNPLAGGTYYAKAEHWLNSAEIPSYDITLTVNPCPTPAILANHSYYTTTFDLIVVGEVQNNGEIGLNWVNVIANLFNSNDQLIDIGTSTIELNVLPPGEKTCFKLYFDTYNGWSYYQFETPTYDSISNNPLQNMTVYGDSGTYTPGDGSYRILGFVRNDNSVRVEYVQPIVTLYDASGTVVGCDYTFVSSTDLNPGQSSSFELYFSGYNRDYADVASYRIQVNGSPQ